MKPLDIDRALADRNLLGAALGPVPSWSTWLTILRAGFGLPLTEDEAIAFKQVAGDRTPPTKPVRELWAIIGRRGGKSRVAAALAIHAACFTRHKLAAGEVGTVLVLAASQAQAQTVFQYTIGFLESSPVLAGEIASITASEIRLRSGIVIAVHANSFRTVRGRTLLACVFDEVAYWRDEASAIPDVETYRAVLPSLATTRGMLIAISTPYRRAGLLYTKHRDCFGRDNADVLVVQGPSTSFNPTLSTDVIAAAIADDPDGGRAEWEAEFRSDISAFLDDAVVEAAIDYSRPSELPPRGGITYRAFCDPSGGRGDNFTLCIGHKEGEHIIADVIRGRAPPFDPQAVTAEYAALIKQYRCGEVVGDNYSAEWVTASFRKCNLRYRRSELVKNQLYLEGLPTLMRGLLSIPDHAKLLREMRLLERRTSRVGKDIVDHGRNGSDDYVNALFGMLRAVIGSPRASPPRFGTYMPGYIKMFDEEPKSNIANPQSRPDSAVHAAPREEPDPKHFKVLRSLPRIW